eukprot:CAMPEP_0204409784 /NCGR_PEP_ID=MMETSP0470-20130426/10316_1 /ASSEMBLY_ACC=CAM_ASM_000385 /TAXON_ID=2969 /ORGANISM="Oxyrrhis marina" /LENGTH=30 /DNA_ID= /DNA_START= /DNA_END= /DNA_ORIENTATION=
MALDGCSRQWVYLVLLDSPNDGKTSVPYTK